MPEGVIMEFFKWFTRLLSVMVLMALVVFGVQANEINTYKNQVNYHIERYGGLTNQALIELTNYSDEVYNNRYRIESPQLNESVDFGETVNYTVVGTFKPIYFSDTAFEIPSSGSAVSLVRGTNNYSSN